MGEITERREEDEGLQLLISKKEGIWRYEKGCMEWSSNACSNHRSCTCYKIPDFATSLDPKMQYTNLSARCGYPIAHKNYY